MSVASWFSGWWKSSAKSLRGGSTAIASFMLGTPGSWSSNHAVEAEKFTGWNYIAVHAIASQAMGAEVEVYQDSDNAAGRKARRKSLRLQYGSIAKYRAQLKALYGQENEETTPLDSEHPLVQLLRRPNRWESGSVFRYRRAQQLRLTGAAYVWNVRNNAGQIIERYVLPTACLSPRPPSSSLPRGGWRFDPGALRYAGMLDADGFAQIPTWMKVMGGIIPAEQMQVTYLPHPVAMDDGQSPISAGARWIDTAEAIDTSRYAQVKQGANPSLHLDLGEDVDPSPDELDRIKAKVNKEWGKAENAGKVVVTAGGKAKATPLSTTPKEMDYGTGFKDHRDAILAIHNTPPVAVGMQVPGGYASYVASMRAWRTIAIDPLLKLFSEDDTENIAAEFGPGITVEYTAEVIEDPDLAERQLQTDISAGIRTRNELRALRGLPPLSADLGGDELVGGAPVASSPAPNGFSLPIANPNTPGLTGKSRRVKPVRKQVDRPMTPTLKAAIAAAIDQAQSTDEIDAILASVKVSPCQHSARVTSSKSSLPHGSAS